MKTILREPLLHFLLLAGIVFVLFQQVSNDVSPKNNDIVVSKEQIRALRSEYLKVWQRPPNDQELTKLIQNYIREEVLYREALALGFDKNDGVIRRRMSQKMKFLTENLTDLQQVEDKELQIYLGKNVEQYMQPSHFSFRQIYFNNKKHQLTQGEFVSLLKKLQNGEVDPKNTGDPIMIDHQFKMLRETEISRILGARFLQSLKTAPRGSWQGPIQSGFGHHLIFVSEFVAGYQPKLADVRKQVLRDWSAEKRAENNQLFYENLKQQYNISVADYTKENIGNDASTGSGENP